MEFTKRLDVDNPALPLEELTLEKLQIHDFTEKDAKDLAVLLREHSLGGGLDEIDDSHIARTLADDWGFHYTVTTNLVKCRKMITSYEALNSEDKTVVLGRINSLLSRIEKEPKAMNWKMRAIIGAKKKWYTDVENLRR